MRPYALEVRKRPLVSFVPSRHELDALLPSAVRRQGDLREQPYRLILLAIATGEKSGVLTLRRGPLEKEIVFDSGAAVECNSNIATETLGRFLVSSGKISEAQYQDALASSAARGMALEEWLTERTIIAPADLNRAAQQNLGRKLLEPFHWTHGTWQFSHDAPRVEVVHRVRVPQLIITGIGKVEPFETVETALQDADALHLYAGASPLFDPSELRLGEEQQRTLARIRQGVSLTELRGSSPSSEDLDRFVFALLLLGVAATEGAAPFFELDHTPEQPAPVAPPPTYAPAAATTPALTAIATADELTASSAACRQKDPFDLLGVDANAGAMEITRAFIRAAERFLPTRYEEQNGLREKAQEVFLASARAYAELADPSRRQALIDRRKPAPEVKAAAAAPPPVSAPAQPRRTIIDPEELYRQGRAAAAAGKLRDALGYYEMAAECDSQNGTYAAEVAYCRFQLLISPAAATLKSLKNAVRIDPRCAVAYLYLGKIQETLGNQVEAEAYLGRASMLMQRPRF